MIDPSFHNVSLVSIADSLAHKRGLKMFGNRHRHKPQLSSRSQMVTDWQHYWVALGVVIHSPTLKASRAAARKFP
jgi:hypothetical protein